MLFEGKCQQVVDQAHSEETPPKKKTLKIIHNSEYNLYLVIHSLLKTNINPLKINLTSGNFLDLF